MFSQMTPLADAEKGGEKFGSLKDLRAKSADDLLKAEAQWTSNRPKVDGWLLPKDIYTIFAEGKQNDVPVLAGSNADEGTTLSPYPPNGTAQLYQEQVKRRYPQHAEQFLKLYPAGSDQEARQSHYNAFRDQFFWQMHTWVRMTAKTGHAAAYQYYFTRVPPGPLGERLGSYHAAEIAYVFGNLNPERPWEETDRRLSETMSSYWVNFATTGNPNGRGLPEWPAYKEKNGVVLEFGEQISARANFHLEPVALLDSYSQSQRAGN
jgi:para-nitrobenzyl esterase